MKKFEVFTWILLILILTSFVIATNHTGNQTNSNSTNNALSDIEKAFVCLEDKAKNCTSLTTQEIALTIIATPENIFDECVLELNKRKSGNNWGNIRDTALAILALRHAGINTTDSENWLLTKTRTPPDLIWYLEEDSDGETICNIGYDSNNYEITIGEDKKIIQDAGECLSRAQENFWFRINSACYEKEFSISCDKNFITALLYKNSASPTVYVLEGTINKPSFDTAEIMVSSKCFGEGSCEYEASAWATYALLRTGHDISEFIPYVIAMADTNKKYLPNSFIYSITQFEDYATQLFIEQELGNYWEAQNTAHNRYYDTALALSAIGGSSSEQVKKAKDWLFFTQGENGCWQKSVRDTAMILWSLEDRPGRRLDPDCNPAVEDCGGNSITTCADGNFFCIPTNECDPLDVRKNYYCSSTLSPRICCAVESELKTCSEYGGKICSGGEVCVGNERTSSNTNSCCTGVCETRDNRSGTGGNTECEEKGGQCYDSCLSSENKTNFDCGSGKVCCLSEDDGSGRDGDGETNLTWLLWALGIGIVLALIGILYVYRNKLKLMLFGAKSKFRSDNERSGFRGSPRGPPPRAPPIMSPRPGFPPIRRPSPGVPVRQAPPLSATRDKQMSETFRKLNQMSK